MSNMEGESTAADARQTIDEQGGDSQREREMRKNAVVLRLFKEGKITDEQVSIYFMHQIPKNRKRKVLTTIVNRSDSTGNQRNGRKDNAAAATVIAVDDEPEENAISAEGGGPNRFNIAHASKECKKAVDLRIFNKGLGSKKQYTLNEKATALFQLEEMGMGYLEKIAESINAPTTTVRQWNIPSNKSKILSDWQLALDEYGNEAVARDRKRFRRTKSGNATSDGMEVAVTLNDAMASGSSASADLPSLNSSET